MSTQRHQLLTISEAQSELRCSRSQIYNLLHEGRLTSVKLRRNRLITRASLNQLIEELFEQVDPALKPKA